VLSTLVPQVLLLVRYVSVAGVVIGVADWWYQRHRITTELKMTPREAKDEARREEGSPEARSGRRRAALRLHRQRMTGTAQGADVLVVNPAHFAVGLSYRSGTDRAPRVVARGADEVAAMLRSAAARLGVPVISDPPLARALYGACFVGDVVPTELYEAVAKLLAQVYALRT
jgi:flagellar biosynthetic protein FlhB